MRIDTKLNGASFWCLSM